MGSGREQRPGGHDDHLRELIVRIARRELPAYDEFVRVTTGFVRAQCVVIVRNHGHLDDAVQVVFFKVWEDATRFDPDRGSAIAWLATLARNASVDLVRREQRAVGRIERAGRLDLPPRVRSDCGDETVERHRLLGALDRLPIEQRQAIECAFYGGRTYREVAKELGEAEGTIKGRIRRGLHQLAQLLDEGER